MRSRCAPSYALPEACDRIEPAYGKLRRRNLVQGFRKRLHDDMGVHVACTHVTELLGSLPTAAVQTLAGLRRENEGDTKPFQLDRCHALETTTDTVRRYYPKLSRQRGGSDTTFARPEASRCLSRAESRI